MIVAAKKKAASKTVVSNYCEEASIAAEKLRQSVSHPLLMSISVHFNHPLRHHWIPLN